MLLAAKKRKGQRLKLWEDEITSCVFGPLSFMPASELWLLFRGWLPFKSDLWCSEIPSDFEIDFWPNLAVAGRVEPDMVIRFTHKDKPLAVLMFEIKWGYRIGEGQLINQWEALPDVDRDCAFHIHLVRDLSYGRSDMEAELATKAVGFPKRHWQQRLICVDWKGLIEMLRFHRPQFGQAMNLWAECVLAFLKRVGESAFTGFKWLADCKMTGPPKDEIFWEEHRWFSFLDMLPTPKPIRKGNHRFFWKG